MRRGYPIVFKDSNESSYFEVNSELHLKFYCSDFQKRCIFLEKERLLSGRNKMAFKSEKSPTTDVNTTWKLEGDTK